jgi:hypothetical protein
MPTLRHRVLNASKQPVAGYTATAKPWSASPGTGSSRRMVVAQIGVTSDSPVGYPT